MISKINNKESKLKKHFAHLKKSTSTCFDNASKPATYCPFNFVTIFT